MMNSELHTKENPCDEDMCIVSVLVNNIAEAEEVQLRLAAMTCSIDGKEDRPGHEATDQTCCGGNLEIAEKQEPIE